MNAVAKNLKEIRTKAGYTQDELAAEFHVTRQTISSWETGRSEPDIETLTKLAAFFNADVSELIYGPKKPAYPAMQKKYVIWSVILALIILAGIAAQLWLYPRLVAYARRYYVVLPVTLFLMSVHPVLLAAAGALVPCVFSLRADTSIGKPWRYLLLTLGVLALVPPLGTALQLLIRGEAVTIETAWFPFVLWTGRAIWTDILPFIAGICLFLGCNKEKDAG